MHIFSTQHIWLFIYSACILMFFAHSIFNRFFKQDLIPITVLVALIVQNLPIVAIQNFNEQNSVTIHEILLFIASFCLVSKRYSKKLMPHMFCISTYFAIIALAHAMHLEKIIVPLATMLGIFGLHHTHVILPLDAIVKNNKYFIVLLLMLIHYLIQNASANIFHLVSYIAFSIYFAINAYFCKGYHHKIFYTFFAFFVLTTAHIFTKHYILDAVQATIFYTTIAYFAYSTMGIQNKKTLTWLVIVQTILILLHICYTVFSPSYFLIAKLENQTSSMPVINFFSILAYCTILLSALHVIIATLKTNKAKKDKEVIKTIYTTIVLAILITTQVIHNFLHEISDIVYSATILSLFLQICYTLFTFALLYFAKSVHVHFQKAGMKFTIHKTSTKKMLNFIEKFKIKDYHLNLPLYFLQENVNVVNRAALAIVPVFLLFYLVIALFF